MTSGAFLRKLLYLCHECTRKFRDFQQFQSLAYWAKLELWQKQSWEKFLTQPVQLEVMEYVKDT